MKRAGITLLVSAGLCCFSGVAHGAQTERLYEFDIPQLDADDALMQLAQQSSTPLLVSFGLTTSRQANALIGAYTLEEGIRRLLHGSGIVASIDGRGVIVAKYDPLSDENSNREADVHSRDVKKGLLASVSAFLFGAGGAAAQENAPGAEADGSRLDTIVVTATKREESLQEVPAAISALSEQQLESRGISNLGQLDTSIPNFSFDGGFSGPFTQITMRGIASFVRNAGFETGTSIYVDGVFAGRPETANLTNISNVERIEVLRGPQGTLFGKNTIAGAINIITKKPTQTPEGSITVEVGNYATRRVRGYVSGGIAKDLSGSVSVYANNREGFLLNLPDGQELDDENDYGGSFQLAYDAGGRTDINLRGNYYKKDHLPPFPETLSGTGEFGDTTLYAPGIRTTALDAIPVNDTEVYGFALTLNHELGGDYTFSSISAFARSKISHSEDNDSSPLQVINVRDWVDITKYATQEFRLISPANDRYDFVLGAYFFWQNVDSDHPADAFFPGGTGLLNPSAEIETTSYAVYGNGNLHITDSLTFTAGVRYTIENKDLLDYDYLQTGDFAAASFLNFTDDRTDRNVSPTVGLKYAASDNVNVYVKASRGFKSGGWNTDYIAGSPFAGINIAFAPEEATNYELGLKSELFDRRMTLNIAAFITDYADLQVIQRAPVSGSTIADLQISNAGQATIKGVELESVFVVNDILTLSGSMGFVDAVYDEFKDGGGIGVDFDGNRLNNAPKWNGSFSVDARAPVSFGALVFNANFSHKTGYFSDPSNDPGEAIEGRSLLNGRVGVAFENGWEAYLWAQNALDEVYDTTRRRPYAEVLVNYGAPRTFGLQATYRF